MSERMRREMRHASIPAGATDRHAEPVSGDAGEESRGYVSVLAGRETANHGRVEVIWKLDPPSFPRL